MSDEPETGPYRWEVNAENAHDPGDVHLVEENYDLQQSALKRAKELVDNGYDVRVWHVDANGSILNIWDNEALARL